MSNLINFTRRYECVSRNINFEVTVKTFIYIEHNLKHVHIC